MTPGAGSCNNWVTSVTSPIDYAQQSIRMDWTVSDASRLMLRFTRDSWKNDAPSIYSNLWGDDPFPAVDSNWDQPSRSFVASLNQTFGTSATNSLQFSYSGNEIEITRGGFNAELNAQILNQIQPIFGYANKQYGQDIGHPVFWGGSGYQALWNEAPFLNNQDLYIVKDDYSQVFGKHFVKAGALVSFNRKNEDTPGNGSLQHSAFWGNGGLPAWGNSGTGNILSDFLLRDMTFGFSEQSAGRSAPQRWRDLEVYVADSWQVNRQLTFDFGVRYSLFFNPYVSDNRITSFVPALFDPALGADACNGVLQPPGSNWCQEAGAQGGADGPNRSLMDQDYDNIAPRLGLAWDVFGDGKTAVRAGVGRFFLRERLSPGLSIAGNPPFITTISGLRTLDSTAEPCDGCFGSSLGAPNRGREVDFRTPNSWQWNLTVQREVWRNTTVEVGYVANYGYDLLKTHNPNQVPSGDANGNGIDDRREYVLTTPANGALRAFGVLGDTNMTLWDHTGESTYHSLQTQFVSRFGRGSQLQASYTLSRSRANLALTSSSGSLDANTTQLDNENPDLDWGRPETGRTHIFNASLIWMLPTLQDRPRLTRQIFGDWEIAGILGAGTGQPLTVFSGGLPGFTGGPSGTGYTDNQRPNRVSGQDCRATSGPDEQIINPAAYTVNGFRLGTIGSAERGDCTGPGYFQTDLAFYKNISLTDRVRVQLRWDIFNVFNNTNFLFQGLNTNMGLSSVVLNADQTEIASANTAGNFGQATRARDPRQMQFGFKILW